jgi:hypothetical protein
MGNVQKSLRKHANKSFASTSISGESTQNSVTTETPTAIHRIEAIPISSASAAKVARSPLTVRRDEDESFFGSFSNAISNFGSGIWNGVGDMANSVGETAMKGVNAVGSLLPDYGAAENIAHEELALHHGHNDMDDAMRHADWNRRMYSEIGPFTAWSSGVGHELTGLLQGQPWNEMEMDLHNNAEGRQAASEGRPIDTSKLQTKPGPGFEEEYIDPIMNNVSSFASSLFDSED